MRKKHMIAIASVVIIACSSIFLYYQSSIHSEQRKSELKQKLQQINLKKVDHLMIVAHPDDETIWGGKHLLEGNYLVVCLTNADNPTRHKEFNDVMKASHNQGIILSYPDKVNNHRDDWRKVRGTIEKDISTLLNAKDWKRIVTHNPDGEYGHIHHKMTSSIVSEIAQMQKKKERLYYFAHYVKKREMSEYPQYLHNPMSTYDETRKNHFIQYYPSQQKVMKKLQHMFPYENWIAAYDYH